MLDTIRVEVGTSDEGFLRAMRAEPGGVCLRPLTIVCARIADLAPLAVHEQRRAKRRLVHKRECFSPPFRSQRLLEVFQQGWVSLEAVGEQHGLQLKRQLAIVHSKGRGFGEMTSGPTRERSS
eukprot:1385191-Pleurochrysis_carterae.AAC.2